MGIQESRRTKLLLCSSTVRQVSNFFSLCLLLEGGRREMVPSPAHCSPAPDFSLKKCNQTTYPFLSIPGLSSWTQPPFACRWGMGEFETGRKPWRWKASPRTVGEGLQVGQPDKLQLGDAVPSFCPYSLWESPDLFIRHPCSLELGCSWTTEFLTEAFLLSDEWWSKCVCICVFSSSVMSDNFPF